MKVKIVSLMLRMLARTWRIDVAPDVQQTLTTTMSVIAFWHGQMLPVWYAFRQSTSIAVVSMSKDGNYLAQLLTDWGYELVRGSSSKGGKEVLQTIIEKSRHHRILMTPDGPRGPRLQAKPGAIVCAQRSGVPLYILDVRCNHCVRLRSWDMFMLPYPFAKIQVVVDNIYNIRDTASRREVENILETINARVLNTPD